MAKEKPAAAAPANPRANATPDTASQMTVKSNDKPRVVDNTAAAKNTRVAPKATKRVIEGRTVVSYS